MSEFITVVESMQGRSDEVPKKGVEEGCLVGFKIGFNMVQLYSREK